MSDLMIFEGHKVEVFDLNGEVLFNPYHVGECLELGGEAVRKAISRMNEKQVVKVKNSDVTSSHIRKLNNAGENFLTENEDFQAAQICAPSGQTKKDHMIKLDSAKEMAMLERNEKGKQVRRYFIQVEKKYKEKLKPKVPQTYLEALKELVAVEEEKERLQLELDRSKDWYSIKRVAALNGVSWKIFDWRKLKKVGEQKGYEVRKIFDANYGEVNTYHREVWEAAYPRYEI